MSSVIRTRRVPAIVGAWLALAVAGVSLIGQTPAQPGTTATDPQVRLKWFDQHQAMKQASPSRTSWQFLDRRTSAPRVTDVAVVTPREAHHTRRPATGGLKTDNDGVTWAPFDRGVTTRL
jgi:hypothetical protein